MLIFGTFCTICNTFVVVNHVTTTNQNQHDKASAVDGVIMSVYFLSPVSRFPGSFSQQDEKHGNGIWK